MYSVLHFGNHRIYITTESNFQVNPARAISVTAKQYFKDQHLLFHFTFLGTGTTNK